MAKPFFEQPSLKSPYTVPSRHYALDASGHPLDLPPIKGRHGPRYVGPVPPTRIPWGVPFLLPRGFGRDCDLVNGGCRPAPPEWESVAAYSRRERAGKPGPSSGRAEDGHPRQRDHGYARADYLPVRERHSRPEPLPVPPRSPNHRLRNLHSRPAACPAIQRSERLLREARVPAGRFRSARGGRPPALKLVYPKRRQGRLWMTPASTFSSRLAAMFAALRRSAPATWRISSQAKSVSSTRMDRSDKKPYGERRS